MVFLATEGEINILHVAWAVTHFPPEAISSIYLTSQLLRFKDLQLPMKNIPLMRNGMVLWGQ